MVVSPADGRVSGTAARASRGRLLQVKGVDYGLSELLADEVLAQALTGGPYATIYLSPRLPHRVHCLRSWGSSTPSPTSRGTSGR